MARILSSIQLKTFISLLLSFVPKQADEQSITIESLILAWRGGLEPKKWEG